MDTQLAATHVIHSYSRAQAIEDGFLVNLSEIAPDVCAQHYKHPIACTTEIYDIMERAVNHPKFNTSFQGIIHDMLWMSRQAFRALDARSRLFQVSIVGQKKMLTFKLVCGPGDAGEPVMTIMLPNQD